MYDVNTFFIQWCQSVENQLNEENLANKSPRTPHQEKMSKNETQQNFPGAIRERQSERSGPDGDDDRQTWQGMTVEDDGE